MNSLCCITYTADDLESLGLCMYIARKHYHYYLVYLVAQSIVSLRSD